MERYLPGNFPMPQGCETWKNGALHRLGFLLGRIASHTSICHWLSLPRSAESWLAPESTMLSSRNLADCRFYRERMGADARPIPWGMAELEAFAAIDSSDPFAGRLRQGVAPKGSLQLEAPPDPSLRGALDPPESRGYVGYLPRGAAERLGLTAVCNDGVAAMAGRMVGIVEALEPSMLIVRRDLAAPFLLALKAAGINLPDRVRWVAISEVEGCTNRREADRISARLGVTVWRILRSDAAFLIAGECAGCHAFHLDSAYFAEALSSGHVAITTRFAKICPAV